MRVSKLLLVALLPLAATAAAQDASNVANYPNKPVRIIMGLAPGGSSDAVGRMIADKLKGRWNQPVLVENRPGAATTIAAEFVARSAPDGYTLVSGGSALPLTRYVMKLNFDPLKDLVAVARTAVIPYVFVATPSLPVKNMADYIAYAKANPGKVDIGVVVLAAGDHLAGLQLEKLSGAKYNYILYKGSAAALPELLNGQLASRIDAYGTWKPHHDAGKARILAATSARRLSFAPDVPTVAETVPGYEVVGTTGLMAPSATPRAIIDRIARDIAEILKEADVRERYRSLGWEPDFLDGPGYTEQIRKEDEQFGKMIIDLGIKPQ